MSEWVGECNVKLCMLRSMRKFIINFDYGWTKSTAVEAVGQAKLILNRSGGLESFYQTIISDMK